MTHDANRLLTAGAALGDLDADEQRSYDAHAATCPDCVALKAELIDVLSDLALLAPTHVPPAALLGRVRTAIRDADAADAAPVTATAVPLSIAALTPPAAPSSPPAPVGLVSLDDARARRRRPIAAALAMAAVFALVAVGLGAATARLGSELAQTRAEVAALRTEAASQTALMAALADPAHRTASLAGQVAAPAATAVVVYVPGTTEAWLVADHLPATPAGSTYQLWYADASGAHPLETATWDGNGVMVAPVGVDLATSAAVMVTLEPAGGSTGTPGPEVVFGHL
jgi:hypothetical protein